MQYFWYFTLIMTLSISCQKKPITAIHEIESTELITIDSIQSILTWVLNDSKPIWDGTIPVKGNLQLNENSLVGLNLKISLQKLQIQSKISTQEKKALKQEWLNETGFDIDSLPEIRLIVPSDIQIPNVSSDKSIKTPLLNSLPAKILIENEAHDIILKSSFLNSNKQELSIRFKLYAKNWAYSLKTDYNSSNKYLDARIFIIL